LQKQQIDSVSLSRRRVLETPFFCKIKMKSQKNVTKRRRDGTEFVCVGSSDNTSYGFFFVFFSIFYIYSSSFFLSLATLYGVLSSFGKIYKPGKELLSKV